MNFLIVNSHFKQFALKLTLTTPTNIASECLFIPPKKTPLKMFE